MRTKRARRLLGPGKALSLGVKTIIRCFHTKNFGRWFHLKRRVFNMKSETYLKIWLSMAGMFWVPFNKIFTSKFELALVKLLYHPDIVGTSPDALVIISALCAA